MTHRPRGGSGRRLRARNRVGCLLAAACLTLSATACTPPNMIQGRAASMLYDPDRVGGLPAAGGLSGVRPTAPAPRGDVERTDGGDNDRLALLAVNDIQDFWTSTYPQFFSGDYRPVSATRSYDAGDRASGRVCGTTVVYSDPNASYCLRDDSISWDRGILIPDARKYFGDVSVAAVLAHELGHAVQTRAHTVHRLSRTIVKEQQADCFAGVYLHWVAQGRSTRFCPEHHRWSRPRSGRRHHAAGPRR